MGLHVPTHQSFLQPSPSRHRLPHTHTPGGPLCLSRTRIFGTECPWDEKITKASEDRRGRGEELSERETGRRVLEGGTDKREKRDFGEEGLSSDTGSVIKFRATRLGEICHWWDNGSYLCCDVPDTMGIKTPLSSHHCDAPHISTFSLQRTQKFFQNGTSTFIAVCNRNSLCVCQHRNRSLDIPFSN